MQYDMDITLTYTYRSNEHALLYLTQTQVMANMREYKKQNNLSISINICNDKLFTDVVSRCYELNKLVVSVARQQLTV